MKSAQLFTFSDSLTLFHFLAYKLTIYISITLTLPPSISPVWPDLAKFRHFGQIFIVFGYFLGLIWQSLWSYFGKSVMQLDKFLVWKLPKKN